MRSEGPGTEGWEAYQKALQRKRGLRRAFKIAPVMLLCAACLVAVLLPLFLADSSIPPAKVPPTPVPLHVPVPVPTPADLEKGVDRFLDALHLKEEPLTDIVTLESEGGRFVVETSIVPGLQRHIVKILANSMTEKAAAVVIDPSDGRVLAMAGFDKGGSGEGLCLTADFPAASLIKIVSAAAALEAAGYHPDRGVSFQGRKHTLYRSQLGRKEGRFATKTTLARAFAESVNPVFGKLGIYDLGPETLDKYAQKFLFNREIPFDLPVAVSTIEVPREQFGLAEIASGFNKQTRISPLHAALLASAAANNGTIRLPWFVKRILDDRGTVLYRAAARPPVPVITPVKARELRTLMRETVLHGTCRRALRPLGYKGKLKDVELGAKSGSMGDIEGVFRYDWIVAYALPPRGGKAMAVAVLAVHRERLGIRSQDLTRQIIQQYMTAS